MHRKLHLMLIVGSFLAISCQNQSKESIENTSVIDSLKKKDTSVQVKKNTETKVIETNEVEDKMKKMDDGLNQYIDDAEKEMEQAAD